MEKSENSMKTIETTATVSSNGTLTVNIPVEIEPGQHRILVIVDEAVEPSAAPASFKLPTLKVGSWPKDLSLRREDILWRLGAVIRFSSTRIF